METGITSVSLKPERIVNILVDSDAFDLVELVDDSECGVRNYGFDRQLASRQKDFQTR